MADLGSSIKVGNSYWFGTKKVTSQPKTNADRISGTLPEDYAKSAYGMKYKDGLALGVILAAYNHQKYHGKNGYDKKYAEDKNINYAARYVQVFAPFTIPSLTELVNWYKNRNKPAPPAQKPPTTPTKPPQATPPAPEPKKPEPVTVTKPEPPKMVGNFEKYGAAPMGVKDRKIRTEYDVFPEEYFSGCDTAIYFGDTWVDDVSGISFIVSEKVQPIYGYNSYTWDDIARGSRIVQGQFRIPFKESGYIWSVIDHIAQLAQKAQPNFAYALQGKETPQFVAKAQQTIDEVLKFYAPDGNGYEDRLKMYEQEVWGRRSTDDVAHRDRTFFYHVRDFGGNVQLAPRQYMLKNGFDIYITYGPMEAVRLANGGTIPEKLDVNTTVKAIRGVHLMDVQQVIDASGQPIEEVYTFVAQDLD